MEKNTKQKPSQIKFVDRENQTFENVQLLTEHQLAAHWNISIKTLQAQRWKGCGITFIKIGRSVRYRISDVAAFEQQNMRTSTIQNIAIGQERIGQ